MRYLKLKRGKKKFRHISEGLNLYNKKNDGTIVSDSEIGEMSSLKGKIVILVRHNFLNETRTSK